MLPFDLLPKTTEDGLADRAGRLPVAGPHHLGEAFDAEGDTGVIHGLGDAVCVSDHNVAGVQGNHRCKTKTSPNPLPYVWQSTLLM
jgi:hypothetical protein